MLARISGRGKSCGQSRGVYQMRGFLVWFVSVLAALGVGHYFGDEGRELVKDKTGVDLGGGSQALELELEAANAAAAESQSLTSDLQNSLADAEERAAAIPAAVAVAIVPTLDGRAVTVQSGLRSSRLTTLRLTIENGEDLNCSDPTGKVSLASGPRPKGSPIGSVDGLVNLSRLRAMARSGDRLVLTGLVATCDAKAIAFRDQSYPIT